MSTMQRFPYAVATEKHPAETSQIIEIFASSATFLVGGPSVYVPVTAWKPAGAGSDEPYTDIVIEFRASAAVIIGNGTTERIGIYGQLSDLASGSRNALLGVLGVNLGGTAPQIPIVAQSVGGELVGFSQVVCNVGVYDSLAIGSVMTANVVTGGPLVTVTARPIRRRNFAG